MKKKHYNDIFVSVIMPTFNTVEVFLRQAIESILNQKHHNFEFIITIDGSSNNDKEVVEEYRKKDNRIIVIDNGVNRGLPYSLNNMLNRAQGKYVFRMDSDDIAQDNRISKLIKYLEQNTLIDICGSQVRYISCGKRISKRSMLPISDLDIRLSLFFANPLIHPTVAFRKESIDKVGARYTEGVKSEDYQMWITSAGKELKFHNLRCRLLNYRLHEKQVTKTNATQLSESGKRLMESWLKLNGVTLSNEEMSLYYCFSHGKMTLSEIDFQNSDRLFFNLENIIAPRYGKKTHQVLEKKMIKECLRRSLYNRIKIYRDIKNYKVIKGTIKKILLRGLLFCVYHLNIQRSI